MADLPYDHEPYGVALQHLGQPWSAPAWPGPLLQRPIPDSDRHDLIAVWPYATLPAGAAATAAFAAAREAGAVTFQGVARPDLPPDAAALVAAGFTVRPYKEHFVRRPDLPAPVHSAKTRANLQRALRRWRVVERPLAEHLALVCAWHDTLAQRRQISVLAAPPAAHFATLAEMPGFAALFAEDDAGPAACLIVGVTADRIHFHLIAGSEDAYRERAFYALYHAAIARWGGERTIHLGGAPGGEAGPGIARFKARFANDRATVHLVTAVFDPETCAALAARRGTPGWFPPYRGPHE